MANPRFVVPGYDHPSLVEFRKMDSKKDPWYRRAAEAVMGILDIPTMPAVLVLLMMMVAMGSVRVGLPEGGQITDENIREVTIGYDFSFALAIFGLMLLPFFLSFLILLPYSLKVTRLAKPLPDLRNELRTELTEWLQDVYGLSFVNGSIWGGKVKVGGAYDGQTASLIEDMLHGRKLFQGGWILRDREGDLRTVLLTEVDRATYELQALHVDEPTGIRFAEDLKPLV